MAHGVGGTTCNGSTALARAFLRSVHLAGTHRLPLLVCASRQVPIFDILKKFNGEYVHEDIKAGGRSLFPWRMQCQGERKGALLSLCFWGPCCPRASGPCCPFASPAGALGGHSAACRGAGRELQWVLRLPGAALQAFPAAPSIALGHNSPPTYMYPCSYHLTHPTRPTPSLYPAAGRRRFRITKLPRFLVLHVKRFLKV